MFFELIPPGTHIDFFGKRWIATAFSLAFIAISLLAIPIRGVRVGIDFAGGNEVQVRFAEGVIVDEGKIREVVSVVPAIQDPTVVRYGTEGTREFLIRFAGAEESVSNDGDPGDDAAPSPSDRVEQLERALAEGIGDVTIQRVEYVGPSVGRELQADGLFALVLGMIGILIYVTIRFSWQYAPGAVIALLHDLLVTAGVFVILGLEFNLQVLAALLAILGYSVNDTIVIYDRIRETRNLHSSVNLTELVNQSVNETLSRTILTSGETFLAVLALLLVGGEVIRPFSFAMLIGIVVGTYSTVFIASPIMLWMENWGEKRT